VQTRATTASVSSIPSSFKNSVAMPSEHWQNQSEEKERKKRNANHHIKRYCARVLFPPTLFPFFLLSFDAFLQRPVDKAGENALEYAEYVQLYSTASASLHHMCKMNHGKR
jgi:hypothetical protein